MPANISIIERLATAESMLRRLQQDQRDADDRLMRVEAVQNSRQPDSVFIPQRIALLEDFSSRTKATINKLPDRVRALEKWQAWLTGGGALITVIVPVGWALLKHFYLKD